MDVEIKGPDASLYFGGKGDATLCVAKCLEPLSEHDGLTGNDDSQPATPPIYVGVSLC